MSNILCVGVFLLGLTSTVFASECYECDSQEQPKCDDFPGSFDANVVNCTLGYCFKLVYDPPNSTRAVRRGCTGNKENIPAECKISRSTTPVLPEYAECYLCGSDRCNSVADLKAYVVFGLAAAYLLYLL